MPIITKPATVTKNTEHEFTLNKEDLAAHSVVAADAYFADQANWKYVVINFESPVGNQHETLIFDPSKNPSTAKFKVSEFARDNFNVDSIVIHDFDGGTFRIKRDQLGVATADFDVNFGDNQGE